MCEPPERARAHGEPVAHEAPTCLPLHVEEGLAFELNNRLPHRVVNAGDEVRQGARAAPALAVIRRWHVLHMLSCKHLVG